MHKTTRESSIVHDSEFPKWGQPTSDTSFEEERKRKQRSSTLSEEFQVDALHELDGRDVTLVGEEMHMETADPNPTLYLQLFDHDEDEDDLIGDIQLDVSKYKDKKNWRLGGEWFPLGERCVVCCVCCVCVCGSWFLSFFISFLYF